MIHTLASGSALAVAMIFLGAALTGARRPGELAAAIDAYRILPARSGRQAWWLLVFAETVAALLLIEPSTRHAGAVMAALLALVFLVAILVNVVRGSTDFDCGCGALMNLRPGVPLLLRNLVLLVVCMIVVLVPPRDIDLRQCAVASVVLLVWWSASAMIAAAQWPRDD